jgi:hypothetical protein
VRASPSNGYFSLALSKYATIYTEPRGFSSVFEGRNHHGTAGSLRTTYFQVDDKFFKQKDGMALGRSISLTISNTYMEHFEKLALDSAQHKPSLWLWYVDTFVAHLHEQSGYRMPSATSSLRASIRFTAETVRQCDSFSGCSDVQERPLATKVYRKPTQTG